MANDIATCQWYSYLQYSSHNGTVYENWIEQLHDEHHIGGSITYIINSHYRAICIKFTPIFNSNCVSEYIKFSYFNNLGTDETIPLRYALCNSDINKHKYESYGLVSDEYQISSGELVVLPSGSSNPNDIPSHEETINEIIIQTNKLISGETYYLFIWPAPSNLLPEYNGYYSVHFAIVDNIIIGYNQRFVYIDNGAEYLPYKCYIDNGTNYELYIPYIDNGTSWEIIS